MPRNVSLDGMPRQVVNDSIVNAPAKQNKVDNAAGPRHQGLKRDALDTLKPRFMQTGPDYKNPLLRPDLGKSQALLGELNTMVTSRLKYKIDKFAGTHFLRRIKLMKRRADIDSLFKLRGAIDKAEAAQNKLDRAYNDYDKLRATPIPSDPVQRKQLFTALRQQIRKIEDARVELRESTEGLGEELDARKAHLLSSRSIRGPNSLISFGRRYKYEVLSHWENQSEKLKEIGHSMNDAFRPSVSTDDLGQESNRIDQLERELDAAAKGGGNIARIVGDPKGPASQRLKVGVALQAMRAAEPLSPHLKHALDESALRSPITDLGKGAFNKVTQADLAVPGPNGKLVQRRYALKPLDARINMAGLGFFRGQSAKQTRVFARHAAAHALSKSLGMDLVDEPRLINIKGRLHMALPLAKGASPLSLRKMFKKLADENPHLSRQGLAKLQRDTYAALHENPSLQKAMKDVQLFHAITGNPDGHGDNLNLLFTDADGKEVGYAEIIQMVHRGQTDAVKNLQVKARLYDQDNTFPAMDTIDPTLVDVADQARDGKRVAKQQVPARYHNLGAPPYHTKEDADALARLDEELSQGKLGKEMEWHLAQSGGVKELDALKGRVRTLRNRFEQDHRNGRRVQAGTGRVVDDANRPKDNVDKRKQLSDTAPRTVNYANKVNIGGRLVANFTSLRASLMHKFFPLR